MDMLPSGLRLLIQLYWHLVHVLCISASPQVRIPAPSLTVPQGGVWKVITAAVKDSLPVIPFHGAESQGKFEYYVQCISNFII